MKKIIGIWAFTALLSGCTDSNPLVDIPVNQAASFLNEASEKAAQSQKVMTSYRSCMKQDPSTKECTALFKEMTKELASDGVRMKWQQLKSPKLYQHVSKRLDFLSYL